MRYSIAPVAFAAVAAAIPQGVTQSITPQTSAPAGCSGDYPGSFEIQVVNVTSPAMMKRDALILTLKGGILKDDKGRTGYIAANRQFQFDGPPQTGAIYTAGWSVCQNGTLALGSNTVFQSCLSGSFSNLYDEAFEEQCTPVYIEAINGGASSGTSQMSDGQANVNQIGDGQPQAVSQIADGQIQRPTGSPVQQISDGQVQRPTGAPVSQIGDGQIQAPTSAATGAPVSQIGDGQIQAPTGAPVSQIADGQIQAATSAPAATGAPVSQIADGQIQAGNATSSAMPVQYTGAAAVPTMRSEIFGLAAGVLAVAML